jgi:5-methylcytosine-specific restriction endonuclease McrA
MKIRSCYNAIFLSILKEYETKATESLKEILKPIKKPRKKKETEKASKKKSIPSAIKKLVWNKNIGEDIGKSKCYCCKSTDISQTSFHCGHVIAESKGGKTIVSNLKPICQNCNSSMGTKDMNDFMTSLL